MSDEFAWLDIEPGVYTGLESRAPSMRKHPLGSDRVWECDGEYIWFRRHKANPATLERHNRFVENGDYVHVETQDDVEVWELQESSIFKRKKTINLSDLDNYNVRRQAALAACRRDWKTFSDIMEYLRQRIREHFGAHTAQAELVYTETYMAVMAAISMRNGPSPQEVNQEMIALFQKRQGNQDKIITIGR